MATYFIGAGLETYAHSPTQVVDTGDGINIAGIYGTGYADCFLVDPATGLRTPQSSVWFHGNLSGGRRGPGLSPHIAFTNADGVEFLRLGGGGSFDLIKITRLLGGVWVDLTGTLFAQSHTYDIRCVIHPTMGRISVNVDGTNWINLENIDTSEFGNIAKVRLSQGGYENSIYRQVIVASYNTIGHTVRRRVPTSDVANSGWTGSFADIDDSTNDDSDAINTSTVGAKITFNGSALSATATGSVVKAVAVSARIRNDGGDIPRNAAAVLTLNGVDYQKPYNLVVGPGFAGASTIFDLNPATGLKWGAVIAPANQPFGLIATT